MFVSILCDTFLKSNVINYRDYIYIYIYIYIYTIVFIVQLCLRSFYVLSIFHECIR
jgi:hypothetical protein